MKLRHVATCALLLSSGSASAFSQSSPIFPIGHEAVTVLAAHNSASFRKLPQPVLTTKQKTQQPLCVLKYGAVDPRVCAVVLGNRWVDIMGFNLVPFTSDFRCFSSVAQDQDAVMYDHFLRMEANVGPEGRIHAIEGSIERYKGLLKQAVERRESSVSLVTDGDIVVTTYQDVPLAYFLLGRAMHLLQDSFSPEHTERLTTDFDSTGRPLSSKVVDITSYRCMPGVYKEHTHDVQVRAVHNGGVATQFAVEHGIVAAREHGDLIWNAPTATNEQAQLAELLKGDTQNVATVGKYLKQAPLHAVFASADLFETFLGARAAIAAGRKADADSLIAAHVTRWFSKTEKGMPVTRTEADLAACKAPGLISKFEAMKEINDRVAKCLVQTTKNRAPGESHKPPFYWVGKVTGIK